MLLFHNMELVSVPDVNFVGGAYRIVAAAVLGAKDCGGFTIAWSSKGMNS